MDNRNRSRWPIGLILAGALVLVFSLSAAFPVYADEPTQETTKYCLTCHGDPNLSMDLPSGETLSLYISEDMLAISVHAGTGIECEACHTSITTYPHPEQIYPDLRTFSRAYYESCQKCHPANYELTLDSMHAQAADAGNLGAPVCTDCHGAHDVRPPDEPRSLISATCAECHAAIVDTYRGSIHGEALLADNPDVPVCTDCHGVHNIQDPRTDLFRVAEPELCAGCHANVDLMDKYGLSADVYDIYKLSWHGVDVSVYKSRWPTIWHDSAICSDCHGVHDILPTHDPNSHVNPDNLLVTCQQCHPDAGPNWTDAWTGHNEISLERTPALFYTKAFYDLFVPFVLWGSVIYVALQIVRASVDRIRRTLS